MSREQSIHFESVREELETVRLRFLQLLNEIPEENWNIRPSGEDWTIKQEMAHIVQVVNILPKGIQNASEGGRRSILALVPASLRNWINGHIVIPFISRGTTRQSIAEAYGKVHKALINALEKFLRRLGTRARLIQKNIERSNRWRIVLWNILRSI